MRTGEENDDGLESGLGLERALQLRTAAHTPNTYIYPFLKACISLFFSYVKQRVLSARFAEKMKSFSPSILIQRNVKIVELCFTSKKMAVIHFMIIAIYALTVCRLLLVVIFLYIFSTESVSNLLFVRNANEDRKDRIKLD